MKETRLFWRYGSNLTPTLNYRFNGKVRLNVQEHKLVEQLNSAGIAFASIEELLKDEAEFAILNSAVQELLESRKEEIETLRLKANNSDVGSKTFNVELLGSELIFDPASIFARFALAHPFLNIADSYLGMGSKLRYYNVWKTFASTETARESQLWHFDREDMYILKIFLYLDEVDDGAGPFTYAPGTHRKGKYSKLKPDHFLEGGVRRTTDEQMDAVYPKEKWMKAVGKKGAVIFADTRGYHKGGEARTRDRLMFTCMYTSPASESKRLITYPKDLDLSNFSTRQRKALQNK